MLMDTKDMPTDELAFMLDKRLKDLKVMGMDIFHNRPKISDQASETGIHPTIVKGVNEEVKFIVEAAQVLTARGCPARIDLTSQHPYVAKKLGEAIKKTSLMKRPALAKAPKRLPRKNKRRRI